MGGLETGDDRVRVTLTVHEVAMLMGLSDDSVYDACHAADSPFRVLTLAGPLAQRLGGRRPLLGAPLCAVEPW